MSPVVSNKKFTESEEKFRFRKTDTIGAADAESDAIFLRRCFTDTGDLSVLQNCDDARRIVVGRTGSGKTALLSELKEQEKSNTIQISPEGLSLSHISNSTILQFFSDAGVKLDLFYKLLWRHVFAVEILKRHFHIKTEKDRNALPEKLGSLFRDRKHRAAVEYIENWGKTFWEETEYRIKETTTKLEQDLKSSIGGVISGIVMGVDAAKKLSDEQRQEVIQRGQKVVNQVQMRQLSDILDFINDVLDDPQQRYYILVDQLDESWVDDAIRYKLIRALVETVRDFRKVQNLKIIIALRSDLLDRVFKFTRDPGFQAEKYDALYLNLQWSKSQLVELLDRRIALLIKHRYTKQTPTHKEILPRSVRQISTIDYILARTLMRPRDVIQFFNKSIFEAAGSTTITAHQITKAEGEYSRGRLQSLADEWAGDYPSLIEFAGAFLKSRPISFELKEITEGQCGDICLNLAVELTGDDILVKGAKEVATGTVSSNDFRHTVFSIFYHVGLVGLKLEGFETVHWSTASGRRNLTTAEISEHAKVYVQPTFWRALGIKEYADAKAAE